MNDERHDALRNVRKLIESGQAFQPMGMAAAKEKLEAYLNLPRDVIPANTSDLKQMLVARACSYELANAIADEIETIRARVADLEAQLAAAEKEAVAKDVSDSALFKAYTTETGKVLPHSWRPIFLDYARIGIKAALLSAADDEVKK